MAAQIAPPTIPAASIAGSAIARPLPPTATPAVAAQIAPRYSCPSPPMFHAFIRNATAAARPVSSSGVATTSEDDMAPGPVTPSVTMPSYVSSAS